MFIFRLFWQWATIASGGLSIIILILNYFFPFMHLDFSVIAVCALVACFVVQEIKIWRLTHPPKPFSLDIIKEQTADICKFEKNDGICVFYLKISNSASSPTQNVRVYVDFTNPTDSLPSNYELTDNRGNYGCDINSKGFALYPIFCVHEELPFGPFYEAWLSPFKVTPMNESIEEHSDYFIHDSVEIKITINSKNGSGEFKIKLNIPPKDGMLADVALIPFK